MFIMNSYYSYNMVSAALLVPIHHMTFAVEESKDSLAINALHCLKYHFLLLVEEELC